MTEPDLFSFGYNSYPYSAGFKAHGTSEEAASSVDAKTLQRLVIAELSKFPMTADEIADRLNIDKLSIRPRCSELKAQNRICETGERRSNLSGRKATVYRVAA